MLVCQSAVGATTGVTLLAILVRRIEKPQEINSPKRLKHGGCVVSPFFFVDATILMQIDLAEDLIHTARVQPRLKLEPALAAHELLMNSAKFLLVDKARAIVVKVPEEPLRCGCRNGIRVKRRSQ